MTISRQLLFVFVLLQLAGCRGPDPTGTVSGKVVYKDRPVTEGMVLIQLPGTGVAANAQLEPGGEFVIPDPVPVGTYQVSVTPPPGRSEDAAGVVTFRPTRIPRKAQDETTSGLTVTVQKGKNEVILDLKD